MKVEDAVAEAMSAHVAGVQAPPGLGREVRRRHRSRVVRVRTIGAALATAAVAVAVPFALGTGEPASTRHVANAPDRAVMDLVTVPDVTGKSNAEAIEILKRAGLTVKEPRIAENIVTQQQPAVGRQVGKGTEVQLTSLPKAVEPQDLGDLGDGRTFGGIHLGYLPEGLVWGEWSGKDGFGKKSYTTSFDEPGQEDGHYSVQVVVYEGDASERIAERLARYDDGSGVDKVDIDGRPAYLGYFTDGGETAGEGDTGATATIGWTLRDGLAVEVFLSPDYAKKADVSAELEKIAEGIEIAR
ncbi:PASTA domain-containing protein [Nonomuraea rhizosphaerae]|uniref:PASTA domain-containing protein n=1 Tax=Nonomuraea rhizosphaerae TaxID=2665663 RepID=UPI001C6062D3|nr:PASTA domain-containing protein [Nonomuraea rhizosphaerae]